MSLTVPVAEIINNSTNPLLAIDPDWERVPLGNIAKILNGFAFKSELFNDTKGTPLIRIRDIASSKTDCYYDDTFDETYIINPGDLLIGMDGDFNSSTWRGPKALLNQRVCKIEVNNDLYNRKFMEYVLPGYLNAINENTSSQTVKHLSSRSISEILLPNPPLDEQERIVARVEALLSQVNAARNRLSRVPVIMKKFRQAVLSAACEGRLTEGWREENLDVESAAILFEKISLRRAKKIPVHLKKMQSSNDDLSNLPDQWIWTQLGFITESMKNGVYKTPNFYNEDGFPCLRMYNIEDGKIIWKNIKHMNLSDNEISTYLLKQRDILINRVNSRELVGKSALITDKIEPCVYESKNIRLRMFNEEIDSQYVVFWLQVNAQKYFNLNAQQTVGMASINQDQIASMPIPLPPLAEQHEIVRRVNALFERTDQIEQQVVVATKRTEALTPAVLGKAFRGELVGRENGKF